jgi:hypothetical protein|tara:strand:+ start:4208 stop:4336 length:129 start_codon:yes stop_codon:yes gene_type:complete
LSFVWRLGIGHWQPIGGKRENGKREGKKKEKKEGKKEGKKEA